MCFLPSFLQPPSPGTSLQDKPASADQRPTAAAAAAPAEHFKNPAVKNTRGAICHCQAAPDTHQLFFSTAIQTKKTNKQATNCCVRKAWTAALLPISSAAVVKKTICSRLKSNISAEQRLKITMCTKGKKKRFKREKLHDQFLVFVPCNCHWQLQP